MAKRKTVEVEVLDFENEVEARDTLNKCNKRLENSPKAKIFAICGSGLFLISFIFPQIQNVCLPVMILLSLIAYHYIGGFGVAFSTALNIGKAAWYLFPMFPMDLIVGMAGVIAGCALLLFMPIIIYGKIVKEIKADKLAAEEYLSNI